MRFISWVVVTTILLMISACEQRYVAKQDSPSAQLTFITSPLFSQKQTLTVDLYQIEDCEKDQPLTKSSPSYQGVLLHHEQVEGLVIEQEVRVEAQKPITLSLSLAYIFSESQSEICYSQFHQFTPHVNGLYQIQVDQECQVRIFNLSENSSQNSIEPITTPNMSKCI